MFFEDRAKKLESESGHRLTQSRRKRRTLRAQKKQERDIKKKQAIERARQIKLKEKLEEEAEAVRDVVQDAKAAYERLTNTPFSPSLRGITYRNRMKTVRKRAEERVSLLKRKYRLINAVEQVKTWMCSVCTYRNSSMNAADPCEMCGTPKPKDADAALTRAAFAQALSSKSIESGSSSSPTRTTDSDRRVVKMPPQGYEKAIEVRPPEGVFE